jgi:hypothetical protein
MAKAISEDGLADAFIILAREINEIPLRLN